MVFSGSSGKSDISQSPVPCSTTRDFAPVTQSGRCLSGTSQLKKRKATTTISRPLASPNRNPRVRSSAPIRESRIMSEIRTVMMDTTIRVPTKVPATTTTLATVSLLKYALAVGSSLEKAYRVTSAAEAQAAIDSISRMKPRTIASRPEINITASRTRSSIVIGIGWSGPPVGSKPRIGVSAPSQVRGISPFPQGRTSGHPSARGWYSGEGWEGHARLTLLTSESRRCGIFLCLAISPGRAARGDIRDQAGQTGDRIERQAGIPAALAAGLFRQYCAAEAEFCGLLQPRRGLRHRTDRAGQRDLA